MTKVKNDVSHIELRVLFEHSQCLPDRTFVKIDSFHYLKWLAAWNVDWKKSGELISLDNYIRKYCERLNSEK